MKRLATILLSTACCVPLPSSAAPRYSVTPLFPDIFYVTQINNDGEVAGTYSVTVGSNVSSAPFWTTGKTIGNSSLDSITSYGRAFITSINNTGGAVGLLDSNSGEVYAFAKPSIDGPLVRIEPGAGMTDLNPRSISYERSNPTVYVAGNATMPGSDTQAFRWSMTGAGQGMGTMQLLGTFGGANSHASDVNLAGQVTGWAETANGEPHAFFYDNGAMQDLGTLRGRESVGNALNDAGTVVGDMRISIANYSTRGFVWDDGQITYIDSLGGVSSTALDVNKHGWVVGSSQLASGESHGYLYRNGELIDLNTLLAPGSGWTIYDALSINDQGDILVYGDSAQYTGYAVLSVPEPATWILLAVGLPLLVATTTRRHIA